MGLTCPAGFMPFASYNEAVSAWTRNTKKFQELNSSVPELSHAEAYFGAILTSCLAGNEKIALVWCFNGQSSEKEVVDVEWILNTLQGAMEKLGVTHSALFPLTHAFRTTLRIIHPTYAPDELISSGVFSAFTVFVPEIRQHIHGNYAAKKGANARIGHGKHEFEVFKFLRSLQNRLRKAAMAEKAEVLQRGIRRLPAPLKTPLRRRLASNDAPIGWHEYCKWLTACPSLGTTKLPQSSDSSLRGMVDLRVFEARRHLDETFLFFEELNRAQHFDFGNMTAHLKPASVRDVLVRYRVIPVEVMEALEYINIKSLTEGAFMLFFVPPSLWETDPVCALDMLGNFRRAVLQANAPCVRPQSVPLKTSGASNDRSIAAFDVESCKQFIAEMKMMPPRTQSKQQASEGCDSGMSFLQHTVHPSELTDDRPMTGVDDDTQKQLTSTFVDDAASLVRSTPRNKSTRSGEASPNPTVLSPAHSPSCANGGVKRSLMCSDDSVSSPRTCAILDAGRPGMHVYTALDAEDTIGEQTITEDIVFPPVGAGEATWDREPAYIDGEEHDREDGMVLSKEEDVLEDDDLEIPEELESTVSPVKRRASLSPPETPIDLAPSPESDFFSRNMNEVPDTAPSDDDALPHTAQGDTTEEMVAHAVSPMRELLAGAGRPATRTQRRRPSLRLEMDSAGEGVGASAKMDSIGRSQANAERHGSKSGNVVYGFLQQENVLLCATKCRKQESIENACRVRKASSPQRRRQHFGAIT